MRRLHDRMTSGQEDNGGNGERGERGLAEEKGEAERRVDMQKRRRWRRGWMEKGRRDR